MILPKAITHAKKTPEPNIEKGTRINLLDGKAVIIPIPKPAIHPTANP
jgi:hypothetical protein